MGDSTVPRIAVLTIFGFGGMVTAPLCEELFFRGLIHHGLSGVWSHAPATIASGFIFAAYHLDLGVLIPFTAVGAMYAWAFQESESIWVPICAHFIANTLGFVLYVAVLWN